MAESQPRPIQPAMNHHEEAKPIRSNDEDMTTDNTPFVRNRTEIESCISPDGNKSAAGHTPIETLHQHALLSRPRLQELVREIDPSEQLDEDVEDLLLQIADDFVENTINAACLFARHRNTARVEVKDVQLYLERNWNMWIPGFGTDELRPYKRATVTEAHKQRLALIRKAIKKY